MLENAVTHELDSVPKETHSWQPEKNKVGRRKPAGYDCKVAKWQLVGKGKYKLMLLQPRKLQALDVIRFLNLCIKIISSFLFYHLQGSYGAVTAGSYNTAVFTALAFIPQTTANNHFNQGGNLILWLEWIAETFNGFQLLSHHLFFHITAFSASLELVWLFAGKNRNELL